MLSIPMESTRGPAFFFFSFFLPSYKSKKYVCNTSISSSSSAVVNGNAGLLCFFVLRVDRSQNHNQHILPPWICLSKVSFFDFFLLLSLFFLLSPSLRLDCVNWNKTWHGHAAGWGGHPSGRRRWIHRLAHQWMHRLCHLSQHSLSFQHFQLLAPSLSVESFHLAPLDWPVDITCWKWKSFRTMHPCNVHNGWQFDFKIFKQFLFTQIILNPNIWSASSSESAR